MNIKDYIDEIEGFKEKYNLTADQICILHIAASFEVYGLNYNKLKEEFTKEK